MHFHFRYVSLSVGHDAPVAFVYLIGLFAEASPLLVFLNRPQKELSNDIYLIVSIEAKSR